jgi:aquaporin Z
MNPACTFGPDLVGRDFGSYWSMSRDRPPGAVIAGGVADVLRGAGGGKLYETISRPAL